MNGPQIVLQRLPRQGGVFFLNETRLLYLLRPAEESFQDLFALVPLREADAAAGLFGLGGTMVEMACL